MPKKDQSEAMISDTGNWNVADNYSKSKIMKPLYLADIYEDIAFFGHESIIDELAGWQTPPNDYIKIKALKRLLRILIRVIENTKFALRKDNTKKTALEYMSSLQKIEAIVPRLVKITTDETNGTQTISIADINIFEQVLRQVSKIKSRINEPLNKNHLIFTDKEEFDPKAFKQNLKDRMINRG